MISLILGVLLCFLSGRLMRGQKVEFDARTISGLFLFALGALFIFGGLVS
jgi:hypothetical protein